MSVTWKINGTPAAALGVGNVSLELVNQQPDRLKFERHDIEFDDESVYTSPPDVALTGGGGSGAAAHATIAAGVVDAVVIDAGGSNYTAPPDVSLTGGGSFGAQAVAKLTPTTVASAAVVSAGSDFTSAPDVTAEGGGGSGAAFTAAIGGRTVLSIAVTNGGSGYSGTPGVTVSGGGGTGCTAVAVMSSGAVVSIAITSGGSGFTSAPTITITGGGGSGATAIAVMEAGAVISITITDGGSGFTTQPFVTLSGGGGYGATAGAYLTATSIGAIDPSSMLGWLGTPTVTLVGGDGSGATAVVSAMDVVVYGVSMLSFGSGYTSRPTVTISGGGGSGATAICEVSVTGKIGMITLIKKGTGFTSTPTVTISGGGGTGATAQAYVSRIVKTVTITAAGSGYTYRPQAHFVYGVQTDVSLVKLTATSVGSVRVTNGGAGYTSAPAVTIHDTDNGYDPSFYPVAVGGVITDLLIIDGGGGYAVAPTLAISAFTGSGATATCAVTSGVVTSITITNGGSGYLYGWQVSVIASGARTGGSGATATANLGTIVASVTLLTPGSGFTSLPSVGFSGGGGSGAAASPLLAPTTIASLSVASAGSGYVSAPTLTIPAGTGVGGLAATALATLTGTSIASVTLLTGGDHYTSGPSVNFVGGGGTGAAASASISVSVIGVTVTAPGNNFTSVPSVTFSSGSAAAVATLTSAGVVSITVTNAGSGATATAMLVGTSVASVALISNGGVLPFDTAITLTRESFGVVETWFQGVIRETPRTRSSLENRIAYVALGPWQWLERIPFLQVFKRVDLTDPRLPLTDYQRGRVVIAQNDFGLKVTLGQFLNLVLDYAIAAKPGVMQREDFSALSLTIPWDEATDLSCAEVISRVLQFLPDAICWFDYAQNPPLLKIQRRAGLDAITLPVHPAGAADSPAYAPLEKIDLRERADLLRSGVYLLYLFTNRANGGTYDSIATDIYPPATLANDPNTLFRTVVLTGSIFQSTELTQKVTVDPLDSALVYSTNAWLSSGSQYDKLRTWWYNHAPQLQHPSVAIKSFLKCNRTLPDGSAVTLGKELTSGSITDWMQDSQNITQEEQVVTAYILYEETLASDSTKKARHVRKFAAHIIATNAQTNNYHFTVSTAWTPPEATPVGLAQAIYQSVSQRQYDGTVALIEAEATRRALVGCVLNLTGSLADWAGMNALVQRATIDLDRGETTLTVGPPRQLGPDDLTELYRVNRNRYPVTSYNARTTGSGGGDGGAQGMGVYHRGGTRAMGESQAPARYMSEMTVAKKLPTATEIAAAVLAAYTGTNVPTEGDVVSITVKGTVKFSAIISLTAIAPEGWRRVSFSFDDVTFYAWIHQVGIY